MIHEFDQIKIYIDAQIVSNVEHEYQVGRQHIKHLLAISQFTPINIEENLFLSS